jgi:hypothetical protein
MCGNSAYAWNTTPHSRARAGRLLTSLPFSRMTPASGLRKPATSRNNVVLPQPLGPRQTTSSPGAIVIVRSNTPALVPG